MKLLQSCSFCCRAGREIKLLLADEPTANLDTATGQKIVRLMRNLGKAHHCTIIIATHDKDIAETTNPIIHLNDGRICGEKE